MGVSGGGHPPHEEWVTRLTYADGHTEDVRSVAGENGEVTVTVPEGVTNVGPTWRADERPPDQEDGSWTTGPGEYQAQLEVAPVTFVIDAGGGGGSR